MNFSLTLSNYPPLKAVLKWSTIPNSTNYVFYRTNLLTQAWQNLTNFLSPLPYPSAPATVTVTDLVNLAVPRYYRVQVDPQLP
ncbi:MAG: hypothetical protein NTZ16_09320 [Verrucomicrobia bacterium]|nr:hypothetical protein [Verrucomicrobiota bacterium]